MKTHEDPDDPIAVFTADHRVEQSNDGGFRINTHDGVHVATFDQSYLAIVSYENGRISVFPKARLGARDARGIQWTLALINQRNAEFWGKKN